MLLVGVLPPLFQRNGQELFASVVRAVQVHHFTRGIPGGNVRHGALNIGEIEIDRDYVPFVGGISLSAGNLLRLLPSVQGIVGQERLGFFEALFRGTGNIKQHRRKLGHVRMALRGYVIQVPTLVHFRYSFSGQQKKAPLNCFQF
ncbi:MAG: hypothetical protein BWX80_04122 [Candidatus Hydrogenedentes bacterium ADurb.Bin101]|nr:MAG: hypothetical protein BWX80_04122 [Candidatus Hydrogenedentes bacterium ADurb.Bin101]